MKDFDISSILAFQPPGYICPVCRGLFSNFKIQKGPDYIYYCPVCDVRYDMLDWNEPMPSVPKMFALGGYKIVEGDMLSHARTLATIIQTSSNSGRAWDKPPKPWPTMRLLLEMLAHAKLFVHFTSWGISHVLIGALKANSIHVPIYGLVSNVESHARTELVDYPEEAPKLKVSVIPSTQGIYDAPHQKIVIIDGLVAFKGSMNLTSAGMRRADRLLDVTEVETNVAKVGELNNKYFAPVWKRVNAPGETFELDWAPF
jgi:hypothetical protein